LAQEKKRKRLYPVSWTGKRGGSGFVPPGKKGNKEDGDEVAKMLNRVNFQGGPLTTFPDQEKKEHTRTSDSSKKKEKKKERKGDKLKHVLTSPSKQKERMTSRKDPNLPRLSHPERPSFPKKKKNGGGGGARQSRPISQHKKREALVMAKKEKMVSLTLTKKGGEVASGKLPGRPEEKGVTCM